jgi:hypothetical protein
VISPALGPAFVVTNPGWLPPIPGSQWISFAANSQGAVNKDYKYQYNFLLPQCFSNANLNLSFMGDNVAKVLLNGQQVGGTFTFTQNPPTYPLTVTASTPSATFFHGLNTLTVVVHNDEDITGFDLVGTVTAK